MHFMKKLVLSFVLIIASCTAQKVTTINTATVVSSDNFYYQKWNGGTAASGSGTTVYMPSAILGDKIVVAMYYGTTKTETYNYVSNDKNQIIVRFQNNPNTWSGIKNMHIDSAQEYGNEPPVFTKPPVELKENQVLIAFKTARKDKINYLLIDNLREKPMLALPSAPR